MGWENDGFSALARDSQGESARKGFLKFTTLFELHCQGTKVCRDGGQIVAGLGYAVGGRRGNALESKNGR